MVLSVKNETALAALTAAVRVLHVTGRPLRITVTGGSVMLEVGSDFHMTVNSEGTQFVEGE